MAGFGKNSRGAKRGSSSSSSSATSHVSTITTVLFVGFCLFGVYMLTSSSIRSSSQSATTSHRPHTRTALSSFPSPRAVLRELDSTPALEDTQVDLPEDAVRSDEEGGGQESEESLSREAQHEQHERQYHAQQQEEVETNRTDEEVRQQQHEQPEQQQQEQEQQEEQQEVQDENSNVGTDENQTQSEDQQQDDQKQTDEEQQQQQQQESENNGEDSQQENQGDTDNSMESDANNNDQDRTKIEQVTSESQQSESEEGGITSQAQIEHDAEGTVENQEQKESSQQQKSEDESANGGSNESNQQSDDNPNVTDGAQSEEVPEENAGDKSTWATQADQSSNEKERRKGEDSSQSNGGKEGGESGSDSGQSFGYEWELCNVTAGPDYIPCLDNEKAIKQLHSFRHYEHRERHCPEESPTCLVPLPKGYKLSIEWPQSRDRIWYNNVPHTKLAEVKGHQNWVKVTGEYLTFPGGGTQFIHGALHYIDFIQQSVGDIAWGKRTRVILDVGCGVASFGGYLFERDVLAMSFAPKDEHEAQVQFALERGIPAISAVMGSLRLPFPSRVFDVVHCARCRVPWHANDGALLLELNRVLRPGGFFVWSATPVYQKLKEDVEIWEAMTSLTKSMCWDLTTIKKDKLNSVGAAIYRKPISNDCYDNRKHHSPPMCKDDDDPNAAWYVPLQSCMHRAPIDQSVRGSQWPQEWPQRVQVPPYWLNSSQMGVYGRPAPDDFSTDYVHWKRVVNKSYLSGLGINWSKVRNVMDMRAVYGGFAAALKDMKVWVMNVVNIDAPDTLPIIYERGLFGIYHDWCESFSSYPRTYDLLHADHLFSQLKKRCNILPLVAEVDRIVRPGGKLIVRDESEAVTEVENLLKSLHWEIRLTFSRNQEGILCAEKSDWRPEKFSASI